MSGGVDSSVAAALLVEQGYDVVGMMMRLWSEETVAGGAHNRCCTPDQMADARRIAAQLGIPFYVLDTKDVFRNTIVEFFVDQHRQGGRCAQLLCCRRCRHRLGCRGLGHRPIASAFSPSPKPGPPRTTQTSRLHLQQRGSACR